MGLYSANIDLRLNQDAERKESEGIAVACLTKINLWTYRMLRVVIGGIFVYSGVVKVMDVKGFARMVSQYELVPDELLATVAYGLPVLELLAGIGLIFEIPWALTAISGMLIMFIGVLWYGVLQGLDIDCGCFSTEELKGHDSLRKALNRDIVMVAVCGYFYLYRIVRIKSVQIADVWPLIKKII
jgi:uncharacterized membrane protein YphA (DoxX/SURF4 family)